MSALYPGQVLRLIARTRFSIKNFFRRPLHTEWKKEPWHRVCEVPSNVSTDMVSCMGITNTGEMFFTQAFVDFELNEQLRESLVDAAKKGTRVSLESYLSPKCRCQIGPHWRCSVHKNWKN